MGTPHRRRGLGTVTGTTVTNQYAQTLAGHRRQRPVGKKTAEKSVGPCNYRHAPTNGKSAAVTEWQECRRLPGTEKMMHGPLEFSPSTVSCQSIISAESIRVIHSELWHGLLPRERPGCVGPRKLSVISLVDDIVLGWRSIRVPTNRLAMGTTGTTGRLKVRKKAVTRLSSGHRQAYMTGGNWDHKDPSIAIGWASQKRGNQVSPSSSSVFPECGLIRIDYHRKKNLGSRRYGNVSLF